MKQVIFYQGKLNTILEDFKMQFLLKIFNLKNILALWKAIQIKKRLFITFTYNWYLFFNNTEDLAQ